jgi:hypothetical protein
MDTEKTDGTGKVENVIFESIESVQISLLKINIDNYAKCAELYHLNYG